MSAAERVLGRLVGVKQSAPGRWIARCPAHEDRSPSLSVRELEDGRVLLHDFAGCGVEAVLQALGLTLADLFEAPLAHSLPRAHTSIPARDLLELLDHEVFVAALIVSDIVRDRRVTPNQFNRLSQASARIGAARDSVNPLRITANA